MTVLVYFGRFVVLCYLGALWYANSEEQGSACAANAGLVSVYEIPLGEDFPNSMPCFIEVAKGSRNKYEWDKDLGFLRLDRVLHSAGKIHVY